MRKAPRTGPAGVSLVEAMVAIGVLAVIVPLALAAMVKAGGIGGSARAETRAPGIAEQCLVELEAARRGKSAYFEPLAAGQEFPSGGAAMALAFGREGEVLGKVSAAEFASGVDKLAGEEVWYLARMSGSQVDPEPAGLLTVTVRVEFPAVKPSAKRDAVTFHTKLP